MPKPPWPSHYRLRFTRFAARGRCSASVCWSQAIAVELLNKRLIDTKPLISDIFSYRDSLKAFETANDRSKAMKVIVDFG
jgi:threonine dehydrogenase-like Zn-dependent dehydrogenase